MVMTLAERGLAQRVAALKWLSKHPGYKKELYWRNPERGRRYTRTYRETGREFDLKNTKRAFMDSLKVSGCVDCGNKNITVLQFDHLRDKARSVSNMRAYSLVAIEREVAKCEVVCANCHIIRTRTRALAA